MACLHCISWRNGWILTKLAQPNCWGMENNLVYFGDLDPIFKVAGGLRLLDNGLSARYLLNEWTGLDQTCTAILLRQRQELNRFFVTLIPFSRLHKGYDFRKWLVSTLSHWGMDEFWPNLHISILWRWVYYDLEFIIDTIYFNNMSVQTGGGIYVFLRKHCSSLSKWLMSLHKHTPKIELL